MITIPLTYSEEETLRKIIQNIKSIVIDWDDIVTIKIDKDNRET